jgi:phosphatidylinositol alpha-1,6-mannosyltransferase
MNVLAVFPEARDHNPGGIQAAAAIAWQALEQSTNARKLEVYPRARLAALRAVRRLRFDADIVLFWHLDLLRLAPFLRNRAHRAVFLHGIEAWRRHGRVTRALLRNTYVLANSAYTLERARTWLPMIQAARAQVVPLGIGAADAPFQHPADPPCAIMIGRLDSGERYKGHHEVIRAWAHVRQQIPDAQLWIVGEGDLRSELELLAAHFQQSDAVRFFGRVRDDEKEALMRAARCLVLPSQGEGFGLVYLEAMRAGRPCVTGLDAGREVIAAPTAGRSVDPTDGAALVGAILQLMTCDVDWERTATAAQQRHADRFTAAHFQQRMIAALQRIA